MIKIGIITNEKKDTGLKYTAMLAECILGRGGKPLMKESLARNAGVGEPAGSEENVINESEMIICLGGDGTFLKVARKVYMKEMPILGINLGSLGFLAEVDRDHIGDAVDKIFEGRYEIERRMMLEAVITRKNGASLRDAALNDIVIARGEVSRILHARTYINNVFVDMFPGDGVIISSPTGSTAYSLSAGGPIVEPDTDLLLITPICPHILYSRSFVAKPDSIVKVVLQEDGRYEAMATFDGQDAYKVMDGDVIEAKRSSHSIKLVKINPMNFFDILRSKIYYRGESLKKDEIQQARQNLGAD